MNKARLVFAPLLIVGTVGIALASACSSESAEGSGGSGGPGGPGGPGGSPSAYQYCLGPKVGEDTSKCSVAELTSFSTCLGDRCARAYEGCLGPDYRNGIFAGPCAESARCEQRCGCDDYTCRSACSPSQECSLCMLDSVGFCETLQPESTYEACKPACISRKGTDADSGTDAEAPGPYGPNPCTMTPDTTLPAGTVTLGPSTWTPPSGPAIDLTALKYGCVVRFGGPGGTAEIRFAASPAYCQSLKNGLHDETIERLVLQPYPWGVGTEDVFKSSVIVPSYARGTNPQNPWSKLVCVYAAQNREEADPASGDAPPLLETTVDPATNLVSGTVTITTGSGAQTITGSFSGLPVFDGKGLTEQLCCK